MRTLVITSFNDKSEIALYQGLHRAGIDIEVICAPQAPEQDTLREAGIPVSRMTLRHRLDLGAVVRLRKRLRERRYDIIHAPRNSGLSVSLLASAGLGTRHIAYRGTIGHLSRWDPASWLTYLNPRVDHIICVSEAVRRYLLSLGLPPARLTTIYKGHDVKWYSGLEAPPLSSLGVPADAFVIGFAGNMRPVKGVDVLIRAASLLGESSPVHVLLIGQVRDRALQRLATGSRASPRLHFTGFRRDAAGLIGRCHAFVMPSLRREGLPRAVIEAMAQGLPCVVSDVGGMPELVHDRSCGLVVPPGDPQALAEAIRWLHSRPQQCTALGRRARERIRTHFNIQFTIENTLRLYREIHSLGRR